MNVRTAAVLLLAASMIAAVPLRASAQSQSPSDGTSQEHVDDWLRELRQIHDELQMLQDLALQDDELRTQRQALGEEIRVAIERLDPNHVANMSRAAELEHEVERASRVGDTSAVERLTAEAERIEEKYFAAQQQVLTRPDIAERLDSFRQGLQSKMVEIEPAAPRLISRMQELQTRLAAIAG